MNSWGEEDRTVGENTVGEEKKEVEGKDKISPAPEEIMNMQLRLLIFFTLFCYLLSYVLALAANELLFCLTALRVLPVRPSVCLSVCLSRTRS